MVGDPASSPSRVDIGWEGGGAAVCGGKEPSFLLQIVDEDDAVAGFSGAEVIEGFIGPRHGEGFGGRGDAVAAAEVEHLVGGRGAAERGAGDGFLAHDEGESADGHGFEDRTDRVKAALWLECGDVGIPVESSVGGVEDEVEAASGFFEFLGVARVEGAVGTELERLLALGVAGGEGSDLTAPGAEKFQRHVAEASDADDGDAIGRLDAKFEDGIEHSDAATEQRAGFGGIETFGNRADPSPVGAHASGESAVTSDDGALGFEAEVLISREA